ncbi:hypothetical protein QBC34DRAFT_209746 [Podospora aff. communis PSN243]|uniref:Uncharacterized protein n=1 Tax=Podospora aff. communis PSN243 TaxID=3040156 RepID=A0AAV9GYV4_9PEZI|nr:hypothetical protein QBC34DRAFT_209746 [Podospora aff. communis PSN243]
MPRIHVFSLAREARREREALLIQDSSLYLMMRTSLLYAGMIIAVLQNPTLLCRAIRMEVDINIRTVLESHVADGFQTKNHPGAHYGEHGCRSESHHRKKHFQVLSSSESFHRAQSSRLVRWGADNQRLIWCPRLSTRTTRLQRSTAAHHLKRWKSRSTESPWDPTSLEPRGWVPVPASCRTKPPVKPRHRSTHRLRSLSRAQAVSTVLSASLPEADPLHKVTQTPIPDRGVIEGPCRPLMSRSCPLCVLFSSSSDGTRPKGAESRSVRAGHSRIR